MADWDLLIVDSDFYQMYRYLVVDSKLLSQGNPAANFAITFGHPAGKSMCPWDSCQGIFMRTKPIFIISGHKILHLW